MSRTCVIQRDYLAHHGILGMRWGKQNGPPYPLSAQDHSAAERNAGWRASLKSGGSGHNYARKIKKELNRLDIQQTKAIYNRNKAEYQEAKAVRKGNAEKASEWAQKKTGWDDYIKSSEKETWKLIGDAAAAGYDIHSRKAIRDVNYGKRMVAHVIGGVLGGTAYQAMALRSSGQSGFVEGNKFKVKKSKGEVPSITIDQRSSKIAETHEKYRQDALNKAKGKQAVSKWQNSDGSLTKKGSKVFKRAVEISNEEVKANARHNQAIKELADYEKKHINKKQYFNSDIDEVELARKKLRDNDLDYNKLIQRTKKAGQEWFDLSISLDQELRNIANKHTSPFTIIGQDRVTQIFRDYEQYQKNKK